MRNKRSKSIKASDPCFDLIIGFRGATVWNIGNDMGNLMFVSEEGKLAVIGGINIVAGSLKLNVVGQILEAMDHDDKNEANW